MICNIRSTCLPIQQWLRSFVEAPGLGEEEGDPHDEDGRGGRVQAMEERSPARDEFRLLEEPKQNEDGEKNKNLEHKFENSIIERVYLDFMSRHLAQLCLLFTDHFLDLKILQTGNGFVPELKYHLIS